MDASGLYQSTTEIAFDTSDFVADVQSKKRPIDGPDWARLLEELQQQAQAIRESGEVAPSGLYVDEYSSKGKQRARLRSTTGFIPGMCQKTKGLGKFGSAQHRDWLRRCDRRNRLQKIERRALTIQKWLEEDS